MRYPSALILTAKYGSGHLQVANALSNYLKQKGFNPIISDLFGESYPVFSQVTQTLYSKTFHYGASFYKLFYYGTNKLNSKGLAQFSQYLGRKRLLELIHEHQPLFVISTFPLHAAPFVLKKTETSIPTYTVITDYCVHPHWINPLVDHYFVGSENVKDILIDQSIPENQITVSGIPIRPQFEQPVRKDDILQRFQLDPHKKVITLLAGANGFLKNAKGLCKLLLQNPAHQIVVICGKNVDLYEKLLPLALLFPSSFRLFSYVENIHELLAVSFCLITKPGGITLTEATSLQVPLILYKPVPGQESENAKYFTERGAAVVARSALETFEHVQQLSKDEEMTKRMRNELAGIHKSHATSTIIDFAISQTEQQSVILR